MGIQKYSLAVLGSLPQLTRNGNYPLKQYYKFIDVCRSEDMSNVEIARLLRIKIHRIVYFDTMRHVYG